LDTENNIIKEQDTEQPEKRERKNKEKKKSNAGIWALKITLITLILSGLFSLIANITMSNSNLMIAIFIVLFLIIISILFDGIAVACTACEIAPLIAMSARKVKGSRTAVYLVKNAGVVNNICSDVIGDIIGIVTGAASVMIAGQIFALTQSLEIFWLTIIISSIVAAITVGSKAFIKAIAIKHSKEFVMSTAKVISIFVPEKKKKNVK